MVIRTQPRSYITAPKGPNDPEERHRALTPVGVAWASARIRHASLRTLNATRLNMIAEDQRDSYMLWFDPLEHPGVVMLGCFRRSALWGICDREFGVSSWSRGLTASSDERTDHLLRD
jgi:hypothetical protein